MRALVGIETALLVLLSVLVAGLLRSHAEILRKLHQLGAGDDAGVAVAVPTRAATPGRGADIAGVTPDGDAVHIGVGGRHPTLLAFLSSGCTTCEPLWDGLGRGEPLPPAARVVVVTKGPGAESPGRVRALAPAGVAVVMSDEAWADYAVPGSPYVVYVHDGRITGEGSARSWDQLNSLLERAATDAEGRRAGRDTLPSDTATPAAPGPPGGPTVGQRA